MLNLEIDFCFILSDGLSFGKKTIDSQFEGTIATMIAKQRAKNMAIGIQRTLGT